MLVYPPKYVCDDDILKLHHSGFVPAPSVATNGPGEEIGLKLSNFLDFSLASPPPPLWA